MIGPDVVVTVLEVRADQVRIGIEAPRSVQVHREEVFRQLAEANTDAVRSAEQLRRTGGDPLRRLGPLAGPDWRAQDQPDDPGPAPR